MREREPEDVLDRDRRAFLETFGKAAVAAPPAITMLLSTAMASPAIAASTGGDAPRVRRVHYVEEGGVQHPVFEED